MSLTDYEIRGLFQTIETAINHFHAFPNQILPKIEELKGMALRTLSAEAKIAEANRPERPNTSGIFGDLKRILIEVYADDMDVYATTLESRRDHYRKALGNLLMRFEGPRIATMDRIAIFAAKQAIHPTPLSAPSEVDIEVDTLECPRCEGEKEVLEHFIGCVDDRSDGMCSLCGAWAHPCPKCFGRGRIPS